MKKLFECANFLLIFVGIIASLCSCRIADSYKEFKFDNIPQSIENVSEDILVSEELAFARVEDTVFIPLIKAVNHDDYNIFIALYSNSDEKSVSIKNYSIKDDNDIILCGESDIEIEFEKSDNSMYEDRINIGSFTEADIDISNGKEYTLVLETEFIKNGVFVSKTLTYDFVIIGYKSFVVPT